MLTFLICFLAGARAQGSARALPAERGGRHHADARHILKHRAVHRGRHRLGVGRFGECRLGLHLSAKTKIWT